MIYNWTVTNLYTIDEGTETDYVVTALYNVTGIEQSGGVEYTASLSNSAQFEVVQGDTFIPYADLTNTIVIGWIQTELGEDGVSNLEASVAGMINSEINPPVSPQNTPLPPNFN
jgi:hypothetical protein